MENSTDKEALYNDLSEKFANGKYWEPIEQYKGSNRFIGGKKTTFEFICWGTYTGDPAKMEEKNVPGYYSIYEATEADFKPFANTLSESRNIAKNMMIAQLFDGYGGQNITYHKMSTAIGSAFEAVSSKWKPQDDNSLPLTFLTDRILVSNGNVLVQDVIPAIRRAAFAQVKHQFGNTFGIQAWYLRSIGDDTHTLSYAHGTNNDIYNYDSLAHIIGIGAKWHLGNHATFSYDWGQNRTDFGRIMNGHINMHYTPSHADDNGVSAEQFSYEGRANDGTPRFWVARLDVGHADTNRPGSWNAFADYKYFQHGSFFGGNGTEGLPDRYLDGIKSFTIGGGYVPAKDILLEAFYTFGAKGIGQRDTLYGPESFTLGDYTRIQATFKF